MTPTREQLEAWARWNGQIRGTPWAKYKAVYLNRLFDDHGGNKGASRSNITAETIRHSESKIELR